jgi:predicted nucleic acid-binding protein
MNVDYDTILFIDAASLISGSGSPTGGSGYLLELGQRAFLKIAISGPVIRETERTLLDKFSPIAYARFQTFLATGDFILATIGESYPEIHRSIAGEKDAHVLSGALQAKADAIITLDRPLIIRVNEAAFGIPVLTPGDFLRGPLRGHPDYARLRQGQQE